MWVISVRNTCSSKGQQSQLWQCGGYLVEPLAGGERQSPSICATCAGRTGHFAMIAPNSIIVLLVPALVLAQDTYDPTDYEHHPMIAAAMEAHMNRDCSDVDIDPESFWMTKFSELVKDRLPNEAVTWNDLLPNLERLSEYDEKGYLEAIAKGKMDVGILQFPSPKLEPLILPAYMPVKYQPEKLPTIVLQQIFNGEYVYEEVLPSNSRKRRSVDDGADDGADDDEVEERKVEQPRLFRHKRNSYSDDIPLVEGHTMNHEVDEVEIGEGGELLNRKRRELPEGMAVFPPKNSMFAVKTLCMRTNATGHIEFPTM
ncbi:uncharacterized protein LOC134762723 [Penaeus indicus]|uniref:uncharacterized protein LOC134762723 n=1 Tax=Penaeus indicus TaxID=29960 RepID=UPI00300D61B7